MKKSIVKRFACALAAAVVNATTSVTAEAKKKKAAKTTISYLGGPFDKNMGIYPGKSDVQGAEMLVFSNMKAKAKYTITTNSKNLSIKMDPSDVKKNLGSSWLHGRYPKRIMQPGFCV